MRYQAYRLAGDRVDVDTDRGTAAFSGNVHLINANGQTADAGPGGVLRINLRRGTYTLTGPRATVLPEDTEVGLILPVYVQGGVVRGRPGFIDARGGEFTTDDFLQPHYSFGARDTYIIPGKRLVARDVTFYRQGHRIFSFPYLVVPLDKRLARQTLFPTFGQTPQDGYFIKFAFGYALASSLPGILRLEEFQKRGTGVGFDQTYGASDRPSRGSGLFTLYNLNDRSRGVDDLNGSLNHTQQFGTIAANLSTQFQQNTIYAGLSKSQSQNSSLSLTRNIGNPQHVPADLPDPEFLRLWPFADTQFGAGQHLSADQHIVAGNAVQLLAVHLARFGATNLGGENRQELDSNLDYHNRGKLVDVEFLAPKYTQLQSTGSNGQFFGGLERLPELRLATDAIRLVGLGRLLPKTTLMDLSLGDFNEPSSQTHSERARFNIDLGTTTKIVTTRSSFDYGGAFQQGFTATIPLNMC